MLFKANYTKLVVSVFLLSSLTKTEIHLVDIKVFEVLKLFKLKLTFKKIVLI